MTKNSLGIIFDELFDVFFMGYLVFLLVETLKSGFIKNFFDINIFLLVVLVSGIGKFIFKREDVWKKEEKKVDWYLISALSLFSGAIVFYKTKEMGSVSYVVSIISTIFVFLLSYITLNDENS